MFLWECRDQSNHARYDKMRVTLAIFLLMSTALAARSDDDVPVGEPSNSIVWTKAFSSISAAKASESIVLIVITNDDPTLGNSSSDEPAGEDLGRKLWCGPVLSRSIRKTWQARPDLRDRSVLQCLPAGMPAALTGGNLRNQPARAIVAVCDGNYRLLAFTIGVPDTEGLLTLIEDADDARLLNQMHRDSRQKRIASIAQRTEERLSRAWRGALGEMMAAMGDGNFGGEEDVNDAVAQQQIGRLTLLHDTYEPHYLADVRLRFGLSEASDRTRLVILEQHPEARRPWAEAMIPFLAGDDFVTLWEPFCETLWGFQPIRINEDDEELLQWWDSQIEAGPVVLSLLPPLPARRLSWPPVDASGKKGKRGLGWQDAQDLAVELSYRAVDAQQLSILLHSRDLRPVDIQNPTRARYLFYEKKKKSGLAIREGEPPGRFVGILKRAL